MAITKAAALEVLSARLASEALVEPGRAHEAVRVARLANLARKALGLDAAKDTTQPTALADRLAAAVAAEDDESENDGDGDE